MQFKETWDLLDGHKTQTSRIPAEKYYQWYAKVNYEPRIVSAEGPDHLVDGIVQSRPIRLISCTVKKLGYVRDKEFWKEGCSSPEAFEAIWERMYHSFNPDLDVCVIGFEVVR